MPNPRTYNDDQLNEISREVYVKSLTLAKEMLYGEAPMNVEKLHALAATADASACGFKSEDEEGEF